LWGTDPVLRQLLVITDMPATAIVFVEHLLPALLVLPLVARGVRRAASVFSSADWVALAVVGLGSSAIATVLFTAAFTYGDPTTPALLQQLQPLFAVAGAWLVLRERPRPIYAVFLAGGLAGAYLVAIPVPGAGSVTGLAPAGLAIAAALLWGSGTVVGRRLGSKLPFGELTALRLATGTIAAALMVAVTGSWHAYGGVGAVDVAVLVGLALIPGLAGLLIYYRGLPGVPATAATLCELAFPATTLVLNYLAFGTTLTLTQAGGAVLIAVTILGLSLVRARGARAAVKVPQLVR
jgi:drug/metabolite transporter (DMT)-like permease